MAEKDSAQSKPQLSARKRWLFRAVVLVLVFLFLEAAGYVSLRILNRRYPMDPFAEITPALVNGFLAKSYDADLGWAPRRNEDDINALGARSRHEYERPEETISAYGDSYTFGIGV